jgi:hypothetical protein
MKHTKNNVFLLVVVVDVLADVDSFVVVFSRYCIYMYLIFATYLFIYLFIYLSIYQTISLRI